MGRVLWFESYVKEQEKKRKHEEFERRKNLVYLRPFDFDRLRYDPIVEKKGVVYKVTAYRSPISPMDLFFDVYDGDNRHIKTFMVTEEENRSVSNLDYHTWNKVDDDMSGNPVIEEGNFYEPDDTGKVDDRDFGKPWHKYNQGRFKVTTREEYDAEHAPVYQRLKELNEHLEKQYLKGLLRK